MALVITPSVINVNGFWKNMENPFNADVVCFDGLKTYSI
jgi:hypothetical protein